MKKLHVIAFYALVAPAVTLGSGVLLAAEDSSEYRDVGEQSMGHDVDPELKNQQQHKDSTKSEYNSPAPTNTEMGDQSGTKNKDYMESMSTNGMAASELIGTDLKSSDDENLGKIGDLIIDQDGQIVAIVVTVDEFLGMGEKRIAIDWNAITMSGNPGEQDLQVEMTRDDLQSAPVYENLDDSRPGAPSNLRVE